MYWEFMYAIRSVKKKFYSENHGYEKRQDLKENGESNIEQTRERKKKRKSNREGREKSS
jgi:hypothetical protein